MQNEINQLKKDRHKLLIDDALLDNRKVIDILYPIGTSMDVMTRSSILTEKNKIRSGYLKEIRRLNHKIYKLENFTSIDIALYRKLPKEIVLVISSYVPMTVQPDLWVSVTPKY